MRVKVSIERIVELPDYINPDDIDAVAEHVGKGEEIINVELVDGIGCPDVSICFDDGKRSCYGCKRYH